MSIRGGSGGGGSSGGGGKSQGWGLKAFQAQNGLGLSGGSSSGLSGSTPSGMPGEKAGSRPGWGMRPGQQLSDKASASANTARPDAVRGSGLSGQTDMKKQAEAKAAEMRKADAHSLAQKIQDRKVFERRQAEERRILDRRREDEQFFERQRMDRAAAEERRRFDEQRAQEQRRFDEQRAMEKRGY